jgi:phosphodiesterase/alkaline phosphatase D-like protein
MILAKQGGWIGQIHQAVMVDLSPDTQYWYRVGDTTSSVWSEIFNFTTLPLNVGSPERPLRVIQIADM